MAPIASPERVHLAGLALEVRDVLLQDGEAVVDLLHAVSLAGVPMREKSFF